MAAVAAEQSPYVGHQQRELKALSAEEVDDLLAGRGMGLALAAELNGYPGPLHVLELADELALSEAQRAATERVFAQMAAEAAELGRQIVERERQLDELFASRRIDEEALARATEELGRLNGSLRGVHLAAHLAVTAVLTEAQRELYPAARGYGDAAAHDPSRHHR